MSLKRGGGRIERPLRVVAVRAEGGEGGDTGMTKEGGGSGTGGNGVGEGSGAGRSKET